MATEKQLALKKALDELVAEKVSEHLANQISLDEQTRLRLLTTVVVDTNWGDVSLSTRPRTAGEQDGYYSSTLLVDAILEVDPQYDTTTTKRLNRLRAVRKGLERMLRTLDKAIAGLEAFKQATRNMTPGA